jgi:hypothetical protein
MNTIDWKHLPFAYMKTDYNVRCYFRDGKWGELELSSSEYIHMHMAATSLHYGQEAFEGLKAFRGKDAKMPKGCMIRQSELKWPQYLKYYSVRLCLQQSG